MALIPVIISGGEGSRLWPMSRTQHPKPFIFLPDGSTLIGQTYERCGTLAGVKSVITVVNDSHYFLARDAYEAIGQHGIDNHFVLESIGRNTAPAIAAATSYAHEHFGPDSILLVLPADHLIEKFDLLQTAVEQAELLAAKGKIVTFGIEPEFPATEYGYIKLGDGEKIEFHEKPSLSVAQAYLEGGQHVWNSGMFCFRADTMLEALKEHADDVYEAVTLSVAKSNVVKDAFSTILQLEVEHFSKANNISIDYAVMEKTHKIACIRTAFKWSDMGSWSAMGALFDKQGDNNLVDGSTMLIDSKNCIVSSNSRLVSLVGVEDLIVVDTPDALLISTQDKAQEVKQVFNALKAEGSDLAKLPRTTHRPWGAYTVLEESQGYKIKRIDVKPGQSLSLQAHEHRSEHWVVVSGTAKVVNGEEVILLKTNQSTYIPCGHKHRLENPEATPLVLIEVQSGDYLGEDDITRFEDIYGRS